jgi:hypothetical protein
MKEGNLALSQRAAARLRRRSLAVLLTADGDVTRQAALPVHATHQAQYI